MANKRIRKRSNARTRRTGKRTRGKLDRVANNAPMRCNVPFDPPQLNCTQIADHIIPYKLASLTTGTAVTVTPPPSIGRPGTITVPWDTTNKKLFTVSITATDIHKAVVGRFGYGSAASEYAVNKIRFWAATAGQTGYLEQTPLLVVDSANVSGGLSVSDTGTFTRRAKIGVSIPIKIWYANSSTVSLMKLNPDVNLTAASASEQGWLYLSVSRRCMPSA